RTQPAEVCDKVRVSAIDMVRVADLREPVRAQGRDDPPGAATDVGPPYRSPGKAFPPSDHGMFSVRTDLGPEPDQLLHEHEPSIEDVLSDHGSPVADRGQ